MLELNDFPQTHKFTSIKLTIRGRRHHDHMVVGFTTIY